MRERLILASLALSSVATACMWDTDTLAEEASFGGDFIAAITGRFPRNPPLYYAMRRDRILAKQAKTLSDYDDLSVAYEKLGDSLAALRWIDRKPHGSTVDEYRTHANRGTFLIHAWLAGKRDIRSGYEGLHELETALKINPDAHFGRERVQVALVRKFLRPTDDLPPDSDPLKAAEAYAGIVRLGAGWDNPDVFRMMAIDLAAVPRRPARLGSIASLALLRADELVGLGRRARLDDGYGFKMVEGTQTSNLADDTRGQFTRLRREADAWQARRSAFMLTRMKAGRHPDTDPTFWNGWSDGAPPPIESHWILNTFGAPVPWWALVLGFLVVSSFVVVPLGLLFLIVRALWRWSVRMRAS